MRFSTTQPDREKTALTPPNNAVLSPLFRSNPSCSREGRPQGAGLGPGPQTTASRGGLDMSVANVKHLPGGAKPSDAKRLERRHRQSARQVVWYTTPDARLRHLVRRIHPLGERPLFE